MQLLVTSFGELVSLLPALCLRNAKSSKNLYIGISGREEVIGCSLTESTQFCCQEYDICVMLYVLMVSKQSWESCLSSHNICAFMADFKGYWFIFHVTLIKNCTCLLCVSCCFSTTLKRQIRLLPLYVQKQYIDFLFAFVFL